MSEAPHHTVRALELLASKICHDLISPIGAIANGVELLEETDDGAVNEVAALLSYSAGQASAKLRAYRIAYGAGGSDHGLKPEEVHKTLGALFSGDKKITQAWDPHGALNPPDRPAGYCKVLMCVFLLAAECLPKGGTITAEAGGGTVTVTAAGENATIRDTMEQALLLKTDAAQIDPRSVHAYLCGLIAAAYGFQIRIQKKTADSIAFTIRKPP